MRGREFAKYGLGFLAGKAGDVCDGRFAGERIFRDVGGMNGEEKAGLGEELAATRRG